jgi:flagellar basal-body rod modification protein FlgD
MSGPVQATPGVADAVNGAARAQAASDGLVSSQAFLTLLVQQLRHQDPLNPMENQEFVSQLAQLSSVEQLTQMNSALQDLRLASAAQIPGRIVAYWPEGSSGSMEELQEGYAGLAIVEDGKINIKVSGEIVPLDQIGVFATPMTYEEWMNPPVDSTAEGESDGS